MTDFTAREIVRARLLSYVQGEPASALLGIGPDDVPVITDPAMLIGLANEFEDVARMLLDVLGQAPEVDRREVLQAVFLHLDATR